VTIKVRYHEDVGGSRPRAVREEVHPTRADAERAADRYNNEHAFLDYSTAEVVED